MEKKYKTYASKMREDLYRNLKLLSVAKAKPIQTLIEEAVTQYLSNRGFSEKPVMVNENVARYSISFDVSKNNKEKPQK